jgi:uncharacterized membrane protein
MAVYTIQDYIICISILIVILWLASRYLFKRIAFDRVFLLAVMPYIIFGVVLRILVDVNVIQKNPYWNVTPGVYITSMAFALLCICIGLLLNRYLKIQYWIFPLAAGTIASAFLAYELVPHITHPGRILYPLMLASSITALIYALSSFSVPAKIFQRRDNLAIIFAHLLDGSSSFIGIDYFNFAEEHLLPEYLISLAGSAIIMIPLKIVVILSALYILERWHAEEKTNISQAEYYPLFKFVFFILGIGPGIRNTALPALI